MREIDNPEADLIRKTQMRDEKDAEITKLRIEITLLKESLYLENSQRCALQARVVELELQIDDLVGELLKHTRDE